LSLLLTTVASSVPFNNDSNGFTSDNVQDAIEEVYSIQGSAFFFTKITSSETITVPSNRLLMYLGNMFTVEGLLIVNGDLIEVD